MQLKARGVEVLHILEFAAPVLTQIHDRADVFGRGDEVRLRIRLLRLGDLGGVGVVERGIDVELRAVGLRDLVDDVRRRRDEVVIVLALQPLLHDVHVQETKEARAEAEAERLGAFGLKTQRRIVKLKLREGVAQRVVLI